jgi:hypothetical protein
MEYTFARIDRLGQKCAVRWQLLKTPNSYHDNVERLVTMKWMITTSTQSALPDWLEFELLEICLCELIRFTRHHPFNRYAWIFERAYLGGSNELQRSYLPKMWQEPRSWL